MKKHFKFLILGLLILPSLLFFSACGEDNNNSSYTITYDYGIASSCFKTTPASSSINSSDGVKALPSIKDDYAVAFKGWFISDSNTQIENLDVIDRNITLEPRFIMNNSAPSGLYNNGKYIKTWNTILTEIPAVFINNATEITMFSEVLSLRSLSGELVIDKSITKIGEAAFFGCTNLTSIILPNSIESIGSYAFEECTKLTNINIPNSIKAISEYAFKDCDNLSSVTYQMV